MMRLKSCPRCRGDIIIDRDEYGWFEQCMQCGYLSDLKNVSEVERRRQPLGVVTTKGGKEEVDEGFCC